MVLEDYAGTRMPGQCCSASAMMHSSNQPAAAFAARWDASYARTAPLGDYRAGPGRSEWRVRRDLSRSARATPGRVIRRVERGAQRPCGPPPRPPSPAPRRPPMAGDGREQQRRRKPRLRVLPVAGLRTPPARSDFCGARAPATALSPRAVSAPRLGAGHAAVIIRNRSAGQRDSPVRKTPAGSAGPASPDRRRGAC